MPCIGCCGFRTQQARAAVSTAGDRYKTFLKAATLLAAYLELMVSREDRHLVTTLVFTDVQLSPAPRSREVMPCNSTTEDLLLEKFRGACLERSEKHCCG